MSQISKRHKLLLAIFGMCNGLCHGIRVITVSAGVSWLIDDGVHCSCWVDTEAHIQCRKEQYRLIRDREAPEEAEKRKHRNWKCLQHGRATIPVEQRRLVRTRNVQVSTSTWGLVCVVTHSLTWTSYMCDWIYENRPYWHKKWNPIYCWLLNLHSWNTKHIAIDDQVCFHWKLIADPFKLPWCNIGSVGPVSGTNKDLTGARLLWTTASTCHVDWIPFCHLLKTALLSVSLWKL